MTLEEYKAELKARWGLGVKSKVAIIGFCQTSRDMVPYNDPDMEFWGLNRGYLFQQRYDRWYDMHGMHIIGNQNRRPGRHQDFLRSFDGPVYVHQRFAELGPNQVVYPLREMAEFFGRDIFRVGAPPPCDECRGRDHQSSGPSCDCGCHAAAKAAGYSVSDTTGEPYLSSSIAYEIALAIFEGFSEIHLYGVDLSTEAEYAWQKPGVEFLLGWAAGHGIKVVLPDNCPLLRGTLYGRGFMAEEGERMSYEQLEQRMTALQNEQAKIGKALNELAGARANLVWIMEQMVPGLDHEMLDERRKQIDRSLAEMQARQQQCVGKIEDTAYWISQTMAGQEPKEAIRQIIAKIDQQRLEAEGPVSALDLLTSLDPAVGNIVSVEPQADQQNGHHAEREIPVGV